jgi:hypothetical protein
MLDESGHKGSEKLGVESRKSKVFLLLWLFLGVFVVFSYFSRGIN